MAKNCYNTYLKGIAMTEISEQLNKVHSKALDAIQSANKRAQDHIQAGNTKGAVNSLNELVDGMKSKNDIIGGAMKERASTAKTILNTSATPVSNVKNILPKGIGNGKTAAIVAGIGLLTAGGVMLYRRTHRQKQEAGSWTQRIEQERLQSPRNPQL